MTKRRITPERPVYPSPAGLITSVDTEGRPNVLTLGEVFNLSIRDPVIVGIAIAKPRYSHELISAAGEFVINMPSADMVEIVDRCGMVSGRKIDKFEAFGLTPLPADIVRPPLIAECPVNIECRLLEVREIGDHDLFAGEVVAVHVDEKALDESGNIRNDRLNPLIFSNWEYMTPGVAIGRIGYTRRG